MSNNNLNLEICKALNVEVTGVTNVEVKLQVGEPPKVIIHKLADTEISAHLARLVSSAEYQELIEDPRMIILMDEMKAYFFDKLHETGSLDAALLKAVWKAYLKGIQVGQHELLASSTGTDVTI